MRLYVLLPVVVLLMLGTILFLVPYLTNPY